MTETIPNLSRTSRRRGMTLVELLVVITIMVMMVAVSVPTLKPMLESQRSSGGARAVAMALQRARAKAMQENTTYGIEFLRFTEGNAPNMSVQMRLVRSGYRFVRIDEETRVRVKDGAIVLCKFDTTSMKWDDTILTQPGNNPAAGTPGATWNEKAKPGYMIQFGRQGRYYTLIASDSSKPTIADAIQAPYANFNLPNDENDDFATPQAVEFNIIQPPRTVLTPPVSLPRGTVVDLQFSGFQSPLEWNANTNQWEQNNKSRDFNSFNNAAKGVIIEFAPSGQVHKCYYTGYENGQIRHDDFEPYGGLFYLCIGEWERQGTDTLGNSLAEDGRNNLITPSNFWVTVHPQTGQVRVTEMGAVPNDVLASWRNASTDGDKINYLKRMYDPARKFASEHFTNVGGF